MPAERDPQVAVHTLQLRLDDVHRRRPDELRDEQVARPVVQLRGLGHLLENAAPHHRHPVPHRHRLGLVVRDVDRRHSEVPLDPRDLGAHLDPELRVEVRERLVHEEGLRVADDRAAHRHTLSLSAGQRARLLPERVGEPEDLGRLAHAPIDLALRNASQLQREAHVLRRVHVRVERVVLEDHGDVAILRREVVDHLAVDQHVPGGDGLEARDHAEGGRLPAARRADEDHELAGGDVEAQPVDGLRPVGVDLGQLLQDDFRQAASAGECTSGQPRSGCLQGCSRRQSIV